MLPAIAFSQVANFEDSFSGHDLSNWSGTKGDFIFVEEDGNTLLQQNATGSGVSYLSIASTNTVGYWEFFVRLDGFNPSNGNKAEIYLMSDSQDLTGPLNGYKLLAGENGSGDVFRFFKITAGAEDGEIITGTTDLSAGGDFRVKVSRDAAGNWTLETAQGYAGLLSVDGTGTDNSYTTTAYFGFKNTYSSTRSNKFFYDFKIDIPPLKVREMSLVNTTDINVVFSRSFDINSVQTSDFILNPGGISPQSAVQQNSETVRLSFANAISSGPSSLTAKNIEDAANQSTLTDTTLSFFVYDAFQINDVVINEFLKDPPFGAVEYVELKNTTSKFLNLKNWQLGDNSTFSTLSNADFTLLPDSFVVVSSDTSALRSFYGTAHYLESPLPAFNNGEDQIRLVNAGGVPVDSLQYDASWGGVKVALERRDASVASIYKENWGESPHPNFGTPGFSNQIQPDVLPPTIKSISIPNSQRLVLALSERLEQTSAETIANYTIRQNPEAGAVSPAIPAITSVTQIAADSLELLLDTPLQEYDGNWTLEAYNLTDIFGNIADHEIDFNYYVIFMAEPGQVAINEFMYDPAPAFSEFIELYNHTDSSFNLQNWSFSDNSGNDKIIIYESYVLPSGEYVILAPDSTITQNFPNAALIDMGTRFSALNNGGDDIIIKNQNGRTIDSLSYQSSWGGKELSLERRSIEFSATFQANWGDSPAQNFATPGSSNQILPDTVPPVVKSTEVVSEDEVRLIFNERMQAGPAQNIQNYELTTQSAGITAPSVQSVTFLAPDTVIVHFQAPFPKKPEGVQYQLQVSNQADVFGNINTTQVGAFFIITYAQPDSGKVFITEFMYDPPELYSEFVEIYNATDSTFNVQNWTLNDNSSSPKVISDNTFALKPKSYLILTPDSTIFENKPAVNFLALGSRFSALNNSGDAIVLRDRNGILLDSLTYTSAWGGKEASVERRSIQFPATASPNWGTSPSEDKATPGAPNAIQPDTEPPEITYFSIINDSALQVIFSEQVQENAAVLIDNYSLKVPFDLPENPPALQSIEFLSPDTVRLFFESKIPRQPQGTKYELAIRNQADIFGNTSSILTAPFFLIDVDTATTGEVAINEFMYEPEAPLSEFIELYNHSENSFDLSGWTLNDNTGNRRTIFDSKFILPTQSYLVLTPDSTLIDLYPNRNIVAVGSRFPSLNNSTDAIVIRDKNGLLIDSLTYYSDWGGKGVSLERREVEITARYKENWGNSPATDSATAGLPNQIGPDVSPPIFEQALIIAKDSIRLYFSERLDSIQANKTDNYTIAPTQTISSISTYSGNALTLVLGVPLQSGTTYTITAKNLTDIFGNTTPSASLEVEYTVFSSSQPNDVLINEILYRRKNANSEEFIELLNRTPQNFNLTGWTLSDATGSAKIPEGTVLKKESYLVLTDTDSSPNQAKQKRASSRVYVPGFPSLNDDGDAIVIKNAQGEVIDSLFYNRTWGGNEPGVSLERRDPESASNDASNWGSSTAKSGNSAGAQSSIYSVDTIPPELLFAKLQKNGSIFVAFTEFVQIQNTHFSINGQEAQVSGYDSYNANEVWLSGLTFSGKEPLRLSLDEAADFRGNTAQNLSIEISQPLAPGKVVINEILFDPLANADDNLPDQSEYIELYNRAKYAVSLEGFFIHDAADEQGKIRAITPYNSSFKWIPAGGYVVLYAENETPHFAESKLAQYFELQEEEGTFFIRADRSNLSLASSDDAVYLADSTGVTIDSVFYDESWQNPNLYDIKGVALERIDPNGPSNDEANWSSSTRVSGGTPGEQNSIFQEAGAKPERAGILFSPNPFSPDDDGFDDNLFINYTLNEPDYLLRVRIFDRYGREVRELTDGKQAGFEGSLIWDGLKDNGSKNRVGIYIVLFEAYNSANGKNKAYKKTVVLARKF